MSKKGNRYLLSASTSAGAETRRPVERRHRTLDRDRAGALPWRTRLRTGRGSLRKKRRSTKSFLTVAMGSPTKGSMARKRRGANPFMSHRKAPSWTWTIATFQTAQPNLRNKCTYASRRWTGTETERSPYRSAHHHEHACTSALARCLNDNSIIPLTSPAGADRHGRRGSQGSSRQGVLPEALLWHSRHRRRASALHHRLDRCDRLPDIAHRE